MFGDGADSYIVRCPNCLEPPGVPPEAFFVATEGTAFVCDECGEPFEEPTMVEIDPETGDAVNPERYEVGDDGA